MSCLALGRGSPARATAVPGLGASVVATSAWAPKAPTRVDERGERTGGGRRQLARGRGHLRRQGHGHDPGEPEALGRRRGVGVHQVGEQLRLARGGPGCAQQEPHRVDAAALAGRAVQVGRVRRRRARGRSGARSQGNGQVHPAGRVGGERGQGQRGGRRDGAADDIAGDGLHQCGATGEVLVHGHRQVASAGTDDPMARRRVKGSPGAT